MRPRAIFFDFGGTLCESRADILPVFQRAIRRAGVELPWERYLQANEECWDELWPSAPALVGSTPAFADRVHAMALLRIGFSGAVEPLVQSIREEALSTRWHRPFADTEPTLRLLRESGFSTHIVSGHVDYLPILVRNLGWSGLFDTVTFTQEVGCQKPDPRVFRFALARAGVEPSESVFVGDSWTADYLGARAVGMDPIWLNRGGVPPPGPCDQVRTLAEVLPWVRARGVG